MRALLVTNDFPPRRGGIQSFLGDMARALGDEVVVLASEHDGAADYDAQAGVAVYRHPSSVLLPTPGVARRARQIVDAHDVDTIWFGAAAPLGLLAGPIGGSLARGRRVVATTHGHESAWASTPGTRQLLARIAAEADAVTYLGDYTRTKIAAAIGSDADKLVRLAPPVDTDHFSPAADPAPLRRRYGLGDAPVVVSVSRLVPRKGQDRLIAAWPAVLRRIPDARLVIVGQGPDLSRLSALAANVSLADRIVFTGAVSYAELPAHHRLGTVMAMPCRSRRRGWDVEGLGIVFLEAQACGVPVVVGRSGGAPDAVLDGQTGRVVAPNDVAGLAATLVELLGDPVAARAMGEAGRRWMLEQWTLPTVAAQLREILVG